MRRRLARLLAMVAALALLCAGVSAEEAKKTDPDVWYMGFKAFATIVGLEEGRLIKEGEYLEAEKRCILRMQEYRGFLLTLMGNGPDELTMVNLAYAAGSEEEQKALDDDGFDQFYYGCICAVLTEKENFNEEGFSACLAAMVDVFNQCLDKEGEQVSAVFTWDGVEGILVYVKEKGLWNMFVASGT